MSLLIEDIADYLEDQGVGTVGEDVFVSHLPQSPDDGVVVTDAGGPGSAQTGVDRHDFQVTVRNGDYSTGQEKAEEVYATLDRVWWDTSKYSKATSLPLYLGRNDRGLHSWSINFRATL